MKKHIKIFSLIIILIIADQLTKLWALADLRGSEGIPVISPTTPPPNAIRRS